MNNSASVVLQRVAKSSRSVAVRRALAVSLVAVMIGGSGCSKNKNEDAVQAQDAAVETSEETTQRDAARATTERSGETAARAQAAVQDKALHGYWVLNTEATLAQLPEDAQEPLREVFEQAKTGIAFTPNGEVIMTVTDDGERSDQRATYSVAEKQGQLVKVEFHLDDPRFKEMGVQAFANIEHVDEQTIRYQPYTVEDGVAQASEHVVIMTRASAEDFEQVVQEQDQEAQNNDEQKL